MTQRKKRKSKSKYGQVKHPFLFKITNGNGSSAVHTVMARVRMATKAVDLTVTAEHVRKAIELNGIGYTSKCTMAVCCYAHKDAFPHVVEGHVDWNYSRAYVVSKTKNGLPAECVAYEHDSAIARENDTAGGLKKLLARIERDGPIVVHLRPYRKRSEEGRPGRDRSGSGKRDPKRKGANLRFDVAVLGAQPQAEA